NFDLLEEGLVLAYGAHMDSVEELNTIMKMSTYNAARMLDLQNYGLEVGCNADLTIFECQSPSEAIVGQAEKRYVIRRGQVIAENQRISKMCVPTN
ncbi:MAG: amidohydrolase family protein, partial [Desulfobulbia bacterium]